MKITCESCSAKYTIADDKVRGRKVKIRCKGCGTPIVVDGQQPPAPGSNAEAAAAEGDSVAVDAPSSIAPEAEWSVNLSETEQSSLSTQQIVEGWNAGRINADAYVWKDGMADWVPILESAELGPLLKKPAGEAASGTAAAPTAEGAPAAAAAATGTPTTKAASGSIRPSARAIRPSGAAAAKATTSARLAGGRAQGAPDLFAGVERAGSDEEEVATSAPTLSQGLPQAGATRAQEEKATGARNENSVLFSLDALKAGFSNPKSDAPKPSSGPSDDPFGMGAAPAIAGLGASNSLFSLAENQALLTAPPPPDPPPQRVASAAAAASGAPAPQKKLVLFGAVGVAILGVGLALGLGLGGGKEEPQQESAAADTASKDTNDDKTSKTGNENENEVAKKEDDAKQDSAAKEEAKTEPKADEKDESKDAGGEQAATDPTKSDEKSNGAATRAPTSAAAAPRPARESAKDPPKEAAGPAQPFSKGAAVTALSAAANQAASCKKIGGPTGSGKVTVTFAPSGRVTSANVNGAPFAGTSVGGCVASIFRRAKVPPFSGSQVTVSKSFAIR